MQEGIGAATEIAFQHEDTLGQENGFSRNKRTSLTSWIRLFSCRYQVTRRITRESGG